MIKIRLLQVGKTDESWLQQGIEKYEQRLQHYCVFSTITLASPKSGKGQLTLNQKKREAESILQNINPRDHVILLDNRGKEFSSEHFSEKIEHYIMESSKQELVFVIGGSYGFDQQIYDRANALLSLSQMTFSHQMIRLFFLEQLYRAFTIIKREPYHHK